VVEVLPNGLRVVMQESHAAPVVAIQMWVNVGSADDPEDASGLAHVLEHMVFRGTADRSEGQIAQEIEGSGGQINAWTSFDQTVYHVVIASRYFDRGLEILTDAIQNSRLGDAELGRELEVILEEIKQGEDSTSRVVSRRLFATAYRKHPYRRPVIGREATVKPMTADQVKQFFDAWYIPANMTLVIVGDFSARAALGKIRRLMRPRPGKPPRRGRHDEPLQRRTRISVVHRETQEAYVAMAFHIPGLAHADTAALDLAAVILGQGESSRLTRRVKHEQQLVTTSYAYAYTPADPGLLVIGATAPPERLLKVVEATVREAVALGAADVSKDELQRAKTLVESDAVYQKETVQGLARKLGFYQTVAGTVAFEEAYNRRVREVTPALLREVAARYLRPENLSISVVTRAQGRERELEAEVARAVTAAREQLLQARGAQRPRAPGERVVKVTLKNGARLIVMRDDSVPIVAMRGVWRGGLRYENATNNGINTLLAGLATRGTTTRSANQISEAIEGMAGTIGGFSGQNSFGLHAELLARHWERGLQIVADCLLNPALRPEEVERERRSLVEDIVAQEDNASSVVMRLFNRTLFKRHPYRLDPLGTVETVSALTREQLVRYHRRHYHPSNLVLAVVGDVDAGRVEAKFRELFGAIPRRAERPVQVPREPVRAESDEAYRFVNKQQAHLVVGYPGTTVRNKDRFALEILTSALSGQGGRLFTELRDRQGLAYNVGAYSQEGLEPGYVAVYIATSPEKIQQALEGIERQLQRVRDERLRPQELKRIQRYLVGSYEISLQRKAMLSSYLAFNEAYGLGYQAYATYSSSILGVTAEAVRRVARRYLVADRRVIAVVKPEELTPGAAKQLGQRKAGVVLTKPQPPKKKARSRRGR
jgi:zinc protease